jgi:hypothetical protein
VVLRVVPDDNSCLFRAISVFTVFTNAAQNGFTDLKVGSSM